MQPVAYSPDLEELEPHETETGREMNKALLSILEITSKDYGHVVCTPRATPFCRAL